MVRTIQGYVLPGFGIAAFLGAEDRRLLLRLAHEDDPLGLAEARSVLLGDVVLALPLGERDQGDLFLLDKAIDSGDEGLAHGVHQCRGGEGLTTMEAEERGDTAVGLESGLIDVEVHPVDAFDFQSHMVLEDIGDGTW